MEAFSRADAVTLLRRCLTDGAVIPGKHFRDELQNENLAFPDAMAVLEGGSIYDPPEPDIRTGDWKYRIEGREPGGLWIAIVFCFRKVDTAFLITVFSIREGRAR
jgi:hypothetical protein